MAMKNPPHPGLSVKHDCLDSLGLIVTAAAKLLGVTRQTLNDLVHARRGISPEMAIRLDLAFGGGADTWLRMQTTYDLARRQAGVVEPGLRSAAPSGSGRRRRYSAPQKSKRLAWPRPLSRSAEVLNAARSYPQDDHNSACDFTMIDFWGPTAEMLAHSQTKGRATGNPTLSLHHRATSRLYR